MNSYHSGARHTTSNRVAEMLDATKAEFENILAQEAAAYSSYKEDHDKKSMSRYIVFSIDFRETDSSLVAIQIKEMQSVRQNAYELQMAHEKMKQM